MGGGFAALVREFRIAAALSQNALARRASIDTAHVHRIEKGTVAASRQMALRLAEALDLSPRQTDRLLYAAGHATVTDWQSRAEDYAARLASVYGALDGLMLPDVAEPMPFVRRAVG